MISYTSTLAVPHLVRECGFEALPNKEADWVDGQAGSLAAAATRDLAGFALGRRRRGLLNL